MGAPAFQIADLFEKHNVAVLSSNYTLYGDMSARVMRVIDEWSPETEVYSIDEAFVNLAAGKRVLRDDYAKAGRELQRRVLKWTGIRVSIGIAETKTLAKIAARIAKTSEKARGVLSLVRSPYTEHALRRTPVEDVWGIGRAWSEMLKREGVLTALDLRNRDDVWVRRRMSIVGLRLVHELRGESCLPLEFAPAPKQSLTVSRSFGSPIETLSEMREAVAHFAARAAEKLRKENSVTGVLTLFLSTNRFSADPQYVSSAIVHLPVPTDFTPELIRTAHRAADLIFVEGYRYKKAGVTLMELIPIHPAQETFITAAARRRKIV
jgi:DNA polymerase V